MNPAWRHTGRHAWIFDLDGTLTVAQHDFDAIRAALGIPPGRMILEFIAEQPPSQRTRLHAHLNDMEIALARKARPAAGALTLLAGLKLQGCPIGILTRNNRTNALAALTAIGALDLFPDEFILGRDEVAPKPDPAGIVQLLTTWGCPATAATMVGDYRFDLEAGRNAGCYTVHVSAGRQERWPAMTDLHLSNLHDLGRLALHD